MAENIVDMREIMSLVTIHFRIKHESDMIWRIKIANIFLQLAARILGCKLEFEQLPEDEWVKYIDRMNHGCDD